jgi:hypothetical protein
MKLPNVFEWFTLAFIPFALGVVDAGAGGSGDGAAGSAAGAGGDAGAGAGGAGAGGAAAGLASVDFRTYVNPDGTIANPEGFFGKDALHLSKRFTSASALAKSYVSLERQLSNGNKVAVPGENATPEEWEAFYSKTGRPDKPEAYELKKPDGFPDEIWSEDEVKEFSTIAHKLGLSKKAANALASWQAERVGKVFKGQQEQAEQTKVQAIDALKKEWGAGFEQNVGLAKQAAAHFGGEELLKHPLANDPLFIKAMAKAGAAISEGKLAGGRQSGLSPDTPEAVKHRIGEIRGDKSHPYNVSNHPNHNAAVAEMARLYEKAYPDQGRT